MNNKNKDDQVLWEETIDRLLGDENPCKICLVQVTCRKSFSDGTGCKPLAKLLQRKIDEIKT